MASCDTNNIYFQCVYPWAHEDVTISPICLYLSGVVVSALVSPGEVDDSSPAGRTQPKTWRLLEVGKYRKIGEMLTTSACNAPRLRKSIMPPVRRS